MIQFDEHIFQLGGSTTNQITWRVFHPTWSFFFSHQDHGRQHPSSLPLLLVSDCEDLGADRADPGGVFHSMSTWRLPKRHVSFIFKVIVHNKWKPFQFGSSFEIWWLWSTTPQSTYRAQVWHKSNEPLKSCTLNGVYDYYYLYIIVYDGISVHHRDYLFTHTYIYVYHIYIYIKYLFSWPMTATISFVLQKPRSVLLLLFVARCEPSVKVLPWWWGPSIPIRWDIWVNFEVGTFPHFNCKPRSFW